ncbi:type II secretion system protein J [Candidatus Hydrogenedentota bacterium]
MKNRTTNRRGFTLMELLIAISILATVMTILYGTYQASYKNIEALRIKEKKAQKANFVLTHITENLLNALKIYEVDVDDDQTVSIGSMKMKYDMPLDDEESGSEVFWGKDMASNIGDMDSITFHTSSQMHGLKYLPGDVKRVSYVVDVVSREMLEGGEISLEDTLFNMQEDMFDMQDSMFGADDSDQTTLEVDPDSVLVLTCHEEQRLTKSTSENINEDAEEQEEMDKLARLQTAARNAGIVDAPVGSLAPLDVELDEDAMPEISVSWSLQDIAGLNIEYCRGLVDDGVGTSLSWTSSWDFEGDGGLPPAIRVTLAFYNEPDYTKRSDSTIAGQDTTEYSTIIQLPVGVERLGEEDEVDDASADVSANEQAANAQGQGQPIGGSGDSPGGR